jgi:glycosyltransferase involved in cell wall biosynthesis
MVSGAALVVQRLTEGMARRGHQVLVLASSDRGRRYVEARDGLRLVRLRSYTNPIRVGQKFVFWPRRSLAVELQAFRPDVLHVHDSIGPGLAGVLAAGSLGIPVVLTVHQLPWFVSAYLPPWPGLRHLVEAGLWRFAAWLNRRLTAVVAPSRLIAETVAAHSGVLPQVITNGVDLDQFSPCSLIPDEGITLRRKYNLHPELPVIIYVGRIDADKQVELVVRAAAQAMQTAPAQLLIVGDGKRRLAAQRLCQALSIDGRAHFPGYVATSSDLPGLYRLSTVFATASEVEVQSSVVMEAAAAGLPVVAVRASSMPEFVEDGVNGCLAPPRDEGAMAKLLAQLLTNPARARALGQAGRALAERHSLEHSFAAHERLYASLAARS